MIVAAPEADHAEPRDVSELLEADLAPGSAGEDSELLEAAADMLIELTNLTVEMARFEHASYVSEAAGGAPGDGRAASAKFVAGAQEAIRGYWVKFAAWVQHAAQQLALKTLGPRQKWLQANAAELRAMKDFGGAKVRLGSNATPAKIGGMFTAATAAALASVASATAATAAAPGTMESHTAPVAKWAGAGPGVSISFAAHDTYLGQIVEKEIDPSLVSEMLAVAQATFANLERLKGMRAVAQAVDSAAQGGAGDDADQAARIRALSAIGPAIGAMIAAANSVNSKVNAMVMAGLVRALGRSSGAAAEEKAASVPKPAAAKPEAEPKANEKAAVKTETAEAPEGSGECLLEHWLAA
jgi:hypothetical protein